MEEEGWCAVCAEAVEWVAYGPCGHLDVCATCIARLRFVCRDLRCCICKSLSSFVFVTKALGSFTRIINDFSILPADAKDGKVGSYWFHEGIQAYFDDFNEYKVFKAMCRLSCSFCDKSQADGRMTSSRRGKFRSVEQLRDHLSRQHELFFCSLCLELKKVFIWEQKLYTQSQLRRHIRDGDSEVDGDGNERCGFSGHPLCEFCQTPFYGDNELYFHMSTEHYTCHICQRQNPTLYKYYKDYDDLENHFRQAHFICENDSCLEKKFIVFATEADMKRHSALEHGGFMSRSKRNAALQLPTCFRHREREEAHHAISHLSGRGLSVLQPSTSTRARAERTESELLHDASSLQAVSYQSGSIGSGSTSDPVPSSGQVQSTALDFRSVLLTGSAFPPLPRASKRRHRKSKKNSGETSTTAAVGGRSTPGCSEDNGLSMSTPAAVHSQKFSDRSSSQYRDSSTVGFDSHSNRATLIQGDIKDVGTSSSAPDFVDVGTTGPSTCNERVPKGDDDQTANKSLVEAIRAALAFDNDRFDIFKIILKEYRDGVIDAREYMAHVHQFGLAHLILDLAKLCPDPQKRKELMEIDKTNLGDVKLKESAPKRESSKSCSGKPSRKGKEKCEDTGGCSRRLTSSDNIVNHLKELKLDMKPHKEPSSSASVDRLANGKAQTRAVDPSAMPTTEPRRKDVCLSSGCGSNNPTGTIAAGSKKKLKKKLKFLKARVGEGAESAAPVLNCSDLASDHLMSGSHQDSIRATVCGVWRNDGGRRVVGLSQASPSTR